VIGLADIMNFVRRKSEAAVRALLFFSLAFAGCSTAPPNLSQGLLTPQDEKRAFCYYSLNVAANLGKTEFRGTDKVERDDGTLVLPTYGSSGSGSMFSILPTRWILLSLHLSNLQPGGAIGLNLFDWASLAVIPTFSFLDRDLFVGYQMNQKLFKYAAVSYTRYEEQLISILPNPAMGELGPIKRIQLNEAALNLSFEFDLWGIPFVYSAIPKYTWSKHGEIEGGGITTVLGFNFVRDRAKK
jgi:hypothetical protein